MNRDVTAATRAVARCDGWLRIVVGTHALPPLPFGGQEALQWSTDPALELQCHETQWTLVEQGKPVMAGRASVEPWTLQFETGPADIFGFGAATGAWKRNDCRFRIMPLDTMLYAIPGASYTALPFFIVQRGSESLGVVLATTDPLDVRTGGGVVEVRAACDTDRAPIDVLVRRGTLVEIVQDLGRLVGRTFLPPAWALGFHQSRWSYRTAARVLEVGRRLRELNLPADAVHLDIDYMHRYRVFTFHPRRFARPAQLHAELHALGLRTLAIVDPGVSVADYHAYRELHDQDLLLKRADGSSYVGRVWPGATVFPDFMRPEARDAWARLHEPLVAAGVGGIWNDMNDPVFKAGEYYDPLAEDVWHGKVAHRRLRSLYANAMAEATVQGLTAWRPGSRPFVVSRSGYLGIQRHAAVWTGDNHSTWQHLEENLAMVLNLGLSGVPLTGADVGGFARGPGRLGLVKPRRPSPELFVRWMELGALLPFFRVHCTLFARSQDPWSFGPRALEQCRRILRRRYRLMPLLYRLALEAHEQGLPIVRPLSMHYDVPPGQGGAQFLLGRDVLAAPVLAPGLVQRDVYLPAGSHWTDWHRGTVHAGGEVVRAAAPLGETPMFVRGGAVLFLAEPRRNAVETLHAPLAMEIYPPGPGSTGSGSLFLDDGESVGDARLVLDTHVVCDDGVLRVRTSRRQSGFRPPQSTIELRVPQGRFGAATVDGGAVSLASRDLAPESRAARYDTVVVSFDFEHASFAVRPRGH